MLVMTDCGWYCSWESVSVCGRYRWERRRCRPWLGRLSSWSVIVGTNVVCTCCHCFVNLVKLVWLGCKIIVDIDIHKWGNMCISLELFSVCHMWLRVKRKPLLSRPTWSLADLGFTAILLLSFIFYQPYTWRRVWFENPCLKCVIWKSMSEIWGLPFQYKSGAQKPPFLTILQLSGNFNGLYLRNKMWYT